MTHARDTRLRAYTLGLQPSRRWRCLRVCVRRGQPKLWAWCILAAMRIHAIERRVCQLCACLSLLAMSACESEKDKAAAAKEAAAKVEAAKKAEAPAEKPPEKPAEPTAEEKRQKQIARNKERIAEFKATADENAARWTPALEKKAKRLVKKGHRSTKAGLKKILASDHRTPGNSDRDPHRHPIQTLDFCGIKPNSTVIEYGAGAGWYTELLAPLLAKKGKLIVASGDPNGPEDQPGLPYAKRIAFFLEQSPELYGKVEHSINGEDNTLNAELAGKADVVIAFRELHGWQRSGKLDARAKSVLTSLKPGGTFCVVQHRAAKGAKVEDTADKGYLPQDWLVAQLETAGFKLDESSEINANPKDTHDHPEGVWTLPPSLALKDVDKAKYMAIGESDRMTLRFKKP